jgi:hypothetical protein
MTYLLLETIRGVLSDKVLNDSFQPFLVDLNIAIKEDNINVLEPVKDSITGYLEPMLDDHNGVIEFTSMFERTVKTFGLEENKELIPFFKSTLEQLLKDILENYSKIDNQI